ncbi:MAG: pantoate--beta-alanine ligase, partial [Planctomycetota bacterium]
MQTFASPTDVHAAIRRARAQGLSVGCVPTMGALHAGHASLIERARAECSCVVATIFVNPTQFGPSEDFSRYPRTLDADLEICRQAGADLVFTPSVPDMYSPDADTLVRVNRLSTVLEGAHRPGHFDGVTTVVAKLFLITEPDRAYFGQKDFQQQLIIRRMVRDLNFPVEMITCPIVREPDGLAMSSRNRYLSAAERQTATAISQALWHAESLAAKPGTSPASVAQALHQRLTAVPGIQLQYALLADPETLAEVPEHTPITSAVALVAARVGTTRLLDNHILQFSSQQNPADCSPTGQKMREGQASSTP